MIKPDFTYQSEFYTVEESRTLFEFLLKETPWQKDRITVFGKTYDQPRLTCLYGDPGLEYGYSSIKMEARLWSRSLEVIKHQIEESCGYTFNICLMNLYRDGNDSNGWHADNEKELGINPVIASLSLGGVRSFRFRESENKKNTLTTQHTPGSLLIMKGDTQHRWQHCIPKTKKAVEQRINLTFRKVV